MANVQQNLFNFELVSPEEKLMSEPAWQVTIPGDEGDFGVRANHSSLVATIRPGVVRILSEEGKAPVKIFIAGGFADVTATNCTILAEEAVAVANLNKDEIESEISDLQQKMSTADHDIEKRRYAKMLLIAQAKQFALDAA